MQPAAVGEGADQGAVQPPRRPVVDVFDRGGERELGVLEAPGEPPTLPAAPFLIGEQTQAFVEGERLDLRVAQLRFISYASAMPRRCRSWSVWSVWWVSISAPPPSDR